MPAHRISVLFVLDQGINIDVTDEFKIEEIVINVAQKRFVNSRLFIEWLVHF